MGFFGAMSEKVGRGLDWGKAAAKDAWAGAVRSGDNAANYAEQKVQDLWTAAGNKLDQAKEAARAKVHSVAREQAAIAVKNQDLLNSLDRRKDFTAKAVQGCPLAGGPPVPLDGFFLGKDCKDCDHVTPTETKPKKGEGRKPHGCENCGKAFPQVTFTNGIDNSLKEVCTTLGQLSDDFCMEVIGIYNASFKDAMPPPRSADENMALLTAGAKGAGSGALDGLKRGLPEALVAGAATGGMGALSSLGKSAGKGALKGSVIGAGKEGLKQEAPRRLPQSQDALDVIDTLKGRSQQPATKRMADEIANSLRDGQPVNVIGHSEGGVNSVAAIAQAKRVLVDEKVNAMLSADPNFDLDLVLTLANREVEANMAKNLNVTLLGTQQTGLPDGPTYTRIAHKSDLVPDAISGAQDAIGRAGHDKDPTSNGKPSPAVEHFPLCAADGRQLGQDTLNPGTAHSMADSYIPYMREKAGRAKGAPCC